MDLENKYENTINISSKNYSPSPQMGGGGNKVKVPKWSFITAISHQGLTLASFAQSG